MTSERLDDLIAEAQEKLRDYAPGSKEREALLKEITELQKVQTAEYRAEVEAYDLDEKRRFEKEKNQDESRLREAQIESEKKRTKFELFRTVFNGVLIGVTTGLAIFKESNGMIANKDTFRWLPKPKL